MTKESTNNLHYLLGIAVGLLSKHQEHFSKTDMNMYLMFVNSIEKIIYDTKD